MPNRLLPFSTRVNVRSRGYLPHWEVDNAIYFITYRLADSLPQHVIERLRLEYKHALCRMERAHVAEWFHGRLDEFLDAGRGACHLKVPEVASCVIETWQHFDHERYELLAWCIMPNHVHVIAKIFKGADLEKILHSWKSYTSNQANALLKRRGSFWWREYYDHCVRDEDELTRSVRYVLDNPAKAGLKDWPYVWCAGWEPAHQPARVPALRYRVGVLHEEIDRADLRAEARCIQDAYREAVSRVRELRRIHRESPARIRAVAQRRK